MRISFDLDDTLICYATQVPRARSRVPWWWKLLDASRDEPLRLGAPELLRDLSASGHEIWIYTTSLRTERQVKRWLGFYGVRVASVVNAARHEREARQAGGFVSKFPPAFHIELHVDDEAHLVEAGLRLGFRVVHVAPDDQNWALKVRQAVADCGK